MNPFLVDLAIAVLAYFLFGALIDMAVKDPKAHEIFKILLLIACVLFALFGTFLPWKI
jgi:hypothetical protein